MCKFITLTITITIIMTEKQQRNAAREFAAQWAGRGYEKGGRETYLFVQINRQTHVICSFVLMSKKKTYVLLSKDIRRGL